MKFPTLGRFCDVTATALLLAGMLIAAAAWGYHWRDMEVREYCDGLNVVLLDGDRYECVSSPKAK